ncbi:MAG TPA: glycerophosphodiester phosphodiesterase [Pirellulales bacterium]|jgi:glycerophosphoryl diester phosphodiesterase
MDVEIIAHRGSSFLAPENTLAAVELAWQEGADAVEGDFRLTVDGQIVCLHDDSLMRTAGVDLRPCKSTLAELRKYDIGAWKSPQFVGQHIVTLAELLATVPPGKRYFVEIKCGPEITNELTRIIDSSGLPADQIVIISLDANTICHIKQAIPQCPAYWVVEFKQSAPNSHWAPNVEELLKAARDCRADGLDLMATSPIEAGPLNTALIDSLKSAGLDRCVWTVDDPILAQSLINLGIQGITTNRPGWLRQQLLA